MASRRQKHEVLAAHRDGGIVPVIRADRRPIRRCKIAEALVAGGIRTLEITMTVPDALGAIRDGRGPVRQRRAARRGNRHEPGAR